MSARTAPHLDALLSFCEAHDLHVTVNVMRSGAPDLWHQAATLHGVAQAFLDPTGQPWEELEAHYRQDSLGQVRAHLGQQQFEQAHSQGMTLSSDQALNLASGKALPA
jgi:hypothetical protein